jgi:hypothetical protein
VPGGDPAQPRPAGHNSPVRRAVPWALLGLLLVAAVVAAVIGQVQTPGQTSAQWVAGVLATTRAAGTAHFTIDSHETSQVASLRGSSSESGVVDFATGNDRDTEVSRSEQWSSTDGGPTHVSLVRQVDKTVDLGKWTYDNAFGSWMRTPRDRRLDDSLGIADGSDVLFLPLSGDDLGFRLQNAGPATVGGVATTRYVVTPVLPPSCVDIEREAARVGDETLPTSLWVDGAGRLVQARSSIRLNWTALMKSAERQLEAEQKKVPSSLQSQSLLSDAPRGKEVIVTTLHLTDFGLPVRITAPAVLRQPGSSTTFSVGVKGLKTTGSGRAVARARSCARSLGGVYASVGSSVGSSK